MKIAVVGGGASGLVAAIYAKTKENEVIILERNKTCGKKILMTGNGRCNYWNQHFTSNFFHTHEKETLEKIISKDNQEEIKNFFKKIGIIPKIKDGYYYPYSNQAVSILEALIYEAKRLRIKIENNFYVNSIIKKENYFFINDSLKFDKVIIATGGSAAPKTGSDGVGFQLAKSFQHTIYKPLPSLVQLISNEKFLKEWAGVRCESLVSIYENENLIQEQFGEIQLTDYGISGICIFNLSRYASIGLEENQKITIKINFVPFTKQPINIFLDEYNKSVTKRSIKKLLEGFLNKKLIPIILYRSSIKEDVYYEELKKEEQQRLWKFLTSFELPIIGTKSFFNAQVTIGGISIKEINPNTMESLKEKGLYFVGEILDVDGDCGGYNLGFAWISGMLAGKNIKEENARKNEK